MMIGTVMYVVGIVTRDDLYRYIGRIEPELREKLEEADRNAENQARQPRSRNNLSKAEADKVFRARR